MNLRFEPTTNDDILDLIDIQNSAFHSDYVKYGYCPGYNRTYESMRNTVENAMVYKITADGTIVGDIIVTNRGGGCYHLGGLCVIPQYENKGIGQAAMKFLEEQFSDAKHWSLETPADKERNHYFYRKSGFRITDEFTDGSVKLVLFEKDI